MGKEPRNREAQLQQASATILMSGSWPQNRQGSAVQTLFEGMPSPRKPGVNSLIALEFASIKLVLAFSNEPCEPHGEKVSF